MLYIYIHRANAPYLNIARKVALLIVIIPVIGRIPILNFLIERPHSARTLEIFL